MDLQTSGSHWLQCSSARLRNCIGSKNCGSPNLWISKPVTLASWWWASSANLTKTYKDLVYLAAATFQNTVAVAVAVLLWFFLLIFLFLTMFFPWLLFCKFQQWRYNTSKPVDLQTSGSPSQMKPAIALKASCCLSTSGPTFAFGKVSIWFWCLQNDPMGFNARARAFEAALARSTVDLQTCGSPNLWPLLPDDERHRPTWQRHTKT